MEDYEPGSLGFIFFHVCMFVINIMSNRMSFLPTWNKETQRA